MTKQNIEVELLRAELPFGMETIIADELGLTQSYISKQLTGAKPLQDNVRNAVLKKIIEAKAKKKKQIKKLVKILA